MLIVIGIPILIIAGVALLVLGPGWTRAGRYRPGDSWDHEPLLVGADGSKAVAEVEAAGQPAQLADESAALQAAPTSTPGGISVRW